MSREKKKKLLDVLISHPDVFELKHFSVAKKKAMRIERSKSNLGDGAGAPMSPLTRFEKPEFNIAKVREKTKDVLNRCS